MSVPAEPSTCVKGRKFSELTIQLQSATDSRLDYAAGMRGFWIGPIRPDAFIETYFPGAQSGGEENIPSADFSELMNATNETMLYKPLVSGHVVHWAVY